jgi:hypothetical protein
VELILGLRRFVLQMANEMAKHSPGTKWLRFTHISREKIAKWQEIVLILLATSCIIGTASRFEQWMTERKAVHLEFSIGFFAAGCLIFLFSPNRSYIAGASCGFIVLMGTVNAALSRNFAAVPLILVCALVFIVIVWRKGSTEP